MYPYNMIEFCLTHRIGLFIIENGKWIVIVYLNTVVFM